MISAHTAPGTKVVCCDPAPAENGECAYGETYTVAAIYPKPDYCDDCSDCGVSPFSVGIVEVGANKHGEYCLCQFRLPTSIAIFEQMLRRVTVREDV
jgi:hypothetical protein